jgi:hypothetical protein
MDTDFLDWALADFSGYVAADELYDGPFCILSAVDNRRYKRILYDVLDHDPTHDDIRAFLRRLHTALSARALTLCGVTTDGSALSPEPLREVCGKVRHQICHSILKFFQVDITGMFRMTSSARYVKVGVGSSRPN